MPWDFGFISDVSGWTVATGLGLYVLRKFTTRKWVTDVTLKEAQSDGDKWERVALTLLKVNEQSAGVITDARQAMRASTALIQAFPEVADDDDEQ